VARALRKHGGNLTAVANQFDVTRQAVWAYIARRPVLQQIRDECRESLKDLANVPFGAGSAGRCGSSSRRKQKTAVMVHTSLFETR
jgi:hypothetical protein